MSAVAQSQKKPFKTPWSPPGTENKSVMSKLTNSFVHFSLGSPYRTSEGKVCGGAGLLRLMEKADQRCFHTQLQTQPLHVDFKSPKIHLITD